MEECSKVDGRWNRKEHLDSQWISEAVKEVLVRIDQMLPRFLNSFPSASAVNDRYEPVEKVDWTEGFWTGELWLAYELTNEKKYKDAAEKTLPRFRERLEKKIKTNTHDLGFLYSLSCVAAWKLTGEKEARSSALWAADLLNERYCSQAGIIQAWGALDDPAKQGRMIIDCNLNLPLLFWASQESGADHYRAAAEKHLEQAMKYLVRPDDSTYHTYFMDVHTGRPLRGTTHQGFSDDSCWARGQAWAAYGFALNYRYDKNEELLKTAKRTAVYMLNHLPSDGICYWDLIFQEKDQQSRDTSAMSCLVCGLLEQMLYMNDQDPMKKIYANATAYIMKSLRSNYLTTEGQDGLLQHAVYNWPRKMGVDTETMWGDYFYMEALMRLKKPDWEPYWG
jgi:unsaturated chondroitin disaccharide hydrolase